MSKQCIANYNKLNEVMSLRSKNSPSRPPVQILTRVCSDDGISLLPNNRGQIKLYGTVVVFWSVAADQDVRVVLLDQISVPLNHQSVLIQEEISSIEP